MLDLLRDISEKQTAILSLLQARFDRETENTGINDALLLPNYEDYEGRQQAAKEFLHASNHLKGDFTSAGDKFATWLRAGPGNRFAWRSDLCICTSTGRRILTPAEVGTEAGGVDGVMEKIWPIWKMDQLEGYFSYHYPLDKKLWLIYPFTNRQLSEPVLLRDPAAGRFIREYRERRAEAQNAAGHLWDIYSDISSGLLSIGAVAIMLSYPLAWDPEDRRNDLAFVAGHVAEWGEFDPSGCAIYKNPGTNLFSNALFSAQYHLRSFVSMPAQDTTDGAADGNGNSGIYCKREKLALKSPNGMSLNLVERRYSIALRMIVTERSYGAYTLFSAADRTHGYHDTRLSVIWQTETTKERTRREQGWSRWQDFGLFTMKHQTGLSVFQLQLCNYIESWEEDWAKTLHKLDAASSVKLADISNAQTRERLMYDTHTLERSSHYFEMLHILRIFSQVISENRSNIEDLVSRVNGNAMLRLGSVYRRSDETAEEGMCINRVRDHNWKVIFALQEKAADRLLGKIERKTEEIKSLRDGLFSAQSVREAMKGTQINRYLFVFTIVTIIFLPPTFVATFYGMDIFEQPDASQTRKQFWTVFAAVSSITYISALGAVLVVGARVKEVADRIWGFLRRWQTPVNKILEFLRRKETYDRKDPEDTGLDDSFGGARGGSSRKIRDHIWRPTRAAAGDGARPRSGGVPKAKTSGEMQQPEVPDEFGSGGASEGGSPEGEQHPEGPHGRGCTTLSEKSQTSGMSTSHGPSSGSDVRPRSSPVSLREKISNLSSYQMKGALQPDEEKGEAIEVEQRV